jgi:transposase
VIRRHELSDVEWEFVRPLLTEALRGRKRLDDRMVLNGIVWKFRTRDRLAGCTHGGFLAVLAEPC